MRLNLDSAINPCSTQCNRKPDLLLPDNSLQNRCKSRRCEQQTQWFAEHRKQLTSLSDDHSELVPLLPIPNRTVKRLRANDSVDYPCESRSSSDSLQTKNPQVQTWGFLLCIEFNDDLLERSENKPLSRRAACFDDTNNTYQKVGAKVGHRQTPYKPPPPEMVGGCFWFEVKPGDGSYFLPVFVFPA